MGWILHEKFSLPNRRGINEIIRNTYTILKISLVKENLILNPTSRDRYVLNPWYPEESSTQKLLPDDFFYVDPPKSTSYWIYREGGFGIHGIVIWDK